MNKGKRQSKLHRTKDQRDALVRNLASSLFIHGKIESSKAKLKHAQPYIEKMITRARRNSLSDRRFINAHIADKAAKRLVDEIGPAMKKRDGGYTRVLSVGHKTISAIPSAIMELVSMPEVKEVKKEKKSTKSAEKKPATAEKKTSTAASKTTGPKKK